MVKSSHAPIAGHLRRDHRGAGGPQRGVAPGAAGRRRSLAVLGRRSGHVSGDPAMVGHGTRKTHVENGKTHGIHGEMIYKCWVPFAGGKLVSNGSKNHIKNHLQHLQPIVTNHLTNPIAYLSTGGSSHGVFGQPQKEKKTSD